MHRPTGNIVWKHEDGGVSITHVFFGTDPAKWRDEMVRRGDAPGEAVAINAAIPDDYSARDRWAFEGGRIVVAEKSDG